MNHTRYAAFWNTVNWKLPDGVLAEVWRVDRGNIRARRNRLAKGSPRWRQRRDQANPVFLAAIALEKLKSKKFTSPRPAGPYTNKGIEMSIPTEIHLELLSHNDEGVPSFRLGIELLDANQRGVSATVEPDENMENPQVSSIDDDIGLHDQDRQMLLLAAYEKMVRYHGTGPIGGTIVYSRWVMPDVSIWVRRLTYQSVAGRILRAMRKLQSTQTPAPPIKEFTESVEE